MGSQCRDLLCVVRVGMFVCVGFCCCLEQCTMEINFARWLSVSADSLKAC